MFMPSVETIAHPPVPQPVLWQLLIHDPRAGIHTLSREGRIEFANQRSVDIYLGEGHTPADAIGKTLWELFPEEFANERAKINRDIIDGGETRLVRALWNGQQYYVLTCPHGPNEGGPVDRATSAVHRTSGDLLDWSVDQFGDVITPGVVTLGPFASLTRQELVVLALLGKGMSLKNVAAELHRSVKTIQAHRDAIGQKLGVQDRGELISLVQNAGLSVKDAFRTRIDHDHRAP